MQDGLQYIRKESLVFWGMEEAIYRKPFWGGFNFTWIILSLCQDSFSHFANLEVTYRNPKTQ